MSSDSSFNIHNALCFVKYPSQGTQNSLRAAGGPWVKDPWLKAFWKGRNAIQDNLHREQPHVENNTVQLLASLLDADRQCTAYELAAEVWVCHKTVLHDILVTVNLQRVGYPMKFQRCNDGSAMQSQRPCWTGTEGKETIFLDESSLWTKPGLAHTNQTWTPIKWMEVSQFSSPKESAPYTICCECDVHCGIWHWWDNTAPCCISKQTVNAAYYLTFLQHHLI